MHTDTQRKPCEELCVPFLMLHCHLPAILFTKFLKHMPHFLKPEKVNLLSHVFLCSTTIWSASMGRRSGAWWSLHGRGGVSKPWSSMRRCLSSTWTPVPGTWPSTTTVGSERWFPSARMSWVRQSRHLSLWAERWQHGREKQNGSENEIRHQILGAG